MSITFRCAACGHSLMSSEQVVAVTQDVRDDSPATVESAFRRDDRYVHRGHEGSARFLGYRPFAAGTVAELEAKQPGRG